MKQILAITLVVSNIMLWAQTHKLKKELAEHTAKPRHNVSTAVSPLETMKEAFRSAMQEMTLTPDPETFSQATRDVHLTIPKKE